MSTNFYFNNFPTGQITSEQLLIEDLVIEAMQIRGMDIFYLPRKVKEGNTVDYLYGEDTLKEYTTAYPLEMYLENVTGMDGDQDFISKFGLEIRDEVTMLVSRRRFKFATAGENLIRPREGDLIYVPLVQNFFEIMFVEHENDQAFFYTLGRGRGGNVYVYALKMKQFVFSNEVISTGITDIDEQVRDNYPRSIINLDYGIGSGYFTDDEIVYQGTDLANATAQAVIFSSNVYSTTTPSIQIIRVQGTFETGNIIGYESGTIRYANVVSSIASDFASMDNIFEDVVDNNRIQEEANTIIDWSERNPFGEV